MIVRELFAKLGLDVNAQSFAKGNALIEVAKFGLGKLVDAVVDVAKGFKDHVKESIEYGDNVSKQSQAIGFGTAALQEYRYAASLSNVSSEELDQSVTILTRTMRAAKDGAEEQAKAFTKAGVKYKDAAGKLRPAEDVIADLADHFQSLPDGAEKAGLALQLFGRSGARLIPFLNEGSSGLAALRQEARDLGLVMDDVAIHASEELNDNLDRLGQVSKGLWRGAIAPLLPAINALVKRFLEWRKANAEVLRQRLQAFLGYAVKGVELLGRAFEVSLIFARGFQGGLKAILGYLREHPAVLATIVAGLALLKVEAIAAAVRTAAAWALAAAPFVIIGAAIAALLLLFDDLATEARGGKSLFGLWKKQIDGWLHGSAGDPWWLAAIKEFLSVLKQAIDALNEYERLVNPNAKVAGPTAAQDAARIQAQADAQTLRVARSRTLAGLPLTDAERAVLARKGLQADAFVANVKSRGLDQPLNPGVSGPVYRQGPGGGVLAPTFTVGQISVDARGVTNPEQLGPVITQHLDEWWDGKLEEGHAAGSAPPGT